MISLILVLALVSMYLEVKVIHFVPSLGKAIGKYKPVSLLFSFFLSVLLGAAFHAVGLVIFAAALISTALIQPWYTAVRIGLFDNFRSSSRKHKEEIYRHVNQLVQVTKAIWSIARIPFVVLFAIMDFSELAVRKFNAAFPKGGKSGSSNGS